ncbi:DUF3502 domain-containing protein [Paenibacillus methanolicus]|uniref:Putative aldouronate transport system substrate-binding protein n=1 Tax=Paenibacillus methanolicus TaxID=582686 RepID=A0A5S5BVK3_9BACL|nr:DUF3502 domain-containing protein [Paenibacillus methanolicus]TYP71057.1 putative aldouronate transport system substrate-binding protein [Paenibacillus methanolicus]
MLKSFNRFGIAASAILMIGTILSVFSGSNQELKPSTGTGGSPQAASPRFGIDTSKELLLKGYLIGEASKGMAKVMTELNTRLKKDIHATMQVEYIGWNDLEAEYPLILASGEDADWIYSANWNGFVQHAAKGAYLEITEEMIRRYMPRYYASVNKLALKKASVNGKIYMIPAPGKSPAIPMMAIRGDLRKKYKIPEITKVSDLEPYFEAIKKNEPNMIPAQLSGMTDTNLIYQLMNEQGQSSIQIIRGIGIAHFMEEGTGKLYTYGEEPLASLVKSSAKTMKAWYDAGYINRDYFANKVASMEAFNQGKSAIGLGNTISLRSALAKGKEKGYDVELIPFIDAHGKALAASYTVNGFSLLAGAKNPERTLMAMDLIISEKSYNYLVYYGIEGEHYILNKDGKLELPAGVTPGSNTYPPDASGFWFTDLRQFPAEASWSEDYIQLLKNVQEKYLYTSVLEEFNVNTEWIKSEIAALNSAKDQFLTPLIMGSVQDVDTAFNTYIEKAKAGGLDKVKAEVQKQIDVFMREKTR